MRHNQAALGGVLHEAARRARPFALTHKEARSVRSIVGARDLCHWLRTATAEVATVERAKSITVVAKKEVIFDEHFALVEGPGGPE